MTAAICNKDHPEQLRQCLESLRQVLPPTDGRTKNLVDSFPEVCYVCGPKSELKFVRNKVLREATDDLLAFVDVDVNVDHNWLAGLMEPVSI